jgi:hypothetical protein
LIEKVVSLRKNIRSPKVKENESTAIEGFKAVEFVREARRQIYEETKDMSFEELKEYFANGQKQFADVAKES